MSSETDSRQSSTAHMSKQTGCHEPNRPRRGDILQTPDGRRYTVGRGYRGAGGEARLPLRNGLVHIYPARRTVREWINDGEWVVFYRE